MYKASNNPGPALPGFNFTKHTPVWFLHPVKIPNKPSVSFVAIQSVSKPRIVNYRGRGAYERYNEVQSFDQRVMDQLGDQNPRYYDGGIGGWNPIGGHPLAATAAGRMAVGYLAGKNDAKEIIANLARDRNSGDIIETIKIITHSMGGAYGKGFVAALKDYIRTLPLEQQRQIKITLVADFDPTIWSRHMN